MQKARQQWKIRIISGELPPNDLQDVEALTDWIEQHTPITDHPKFSWLWGWIVGYTLGEKPARELWPQLEEHWPKMTAYYNFWRKDIQEGWYWIRLGQKDAYSGTIVTSYIGKWIAHRSDIAKIDRREAKQIRKMLRKENIDRPDME